MPEFALIERDALTREQRELLVEQAATMIDGLYVHLLHKRAMCGIEPSQRLRLLLPQLTDPTPADLSSQKGRDVAPLSAVISGNSIRRSEGSRSGGARFVGCPGQ